MGWSWGPLAHWVAPSHKTQVQWEHGIGTCRPLPPDGRVGHAAPRLRSRWPAVPPPPRSAASMPPSLHRIHRGSPTGHSLRDSTAPWGSPSPPPPPQCARTPGAFPHKRARDPPTQPRDGASITKGTSHAHACPASPRQSRRAHPQIHKRHASGTGHISHGGGGGAVPRLQSGPPSAHEMDGGGGGRWGYPCPWTEHAAGLVCGCGF